MNGCDVKQSLNSILFGARCSVMKLVCGVNTAEQKKLCLYTVSSFPIRYINFKINFNLTSSLFSHTVFYRPLSRMNTKYLIFGMAYHSHCDIF